MNWYYLNGDKKSGPFSEATMMELRSCEVLSDETQVLREDSEEWGSYRVLFPTESNDLYTPVEFKFHCPHCQQRISTEEDYSGRSFQCPTCGTDFVASSPTEETEIEASSPQEAAIAKPEPSPEPGASHSVAQRLRDGNKVAQEGAKFVKDGAMVGWAGLKRRSKQVALKAQIEKLRNIDLRKALHSLGKKAFEQGVVEEGVAEQIQAIRDLDARIAEMRDKAAVAAGETKMAALKRVSKNTAKASQAQALTLKREHLITELGREIHARLAQVNTQDMDKECAAITDIENQIRVKQDEMKRLDDSGRSQIPTHAAAVFGVIFALIIIVFITFYEKKVTDDITDVRSVAYILKHSIDAKEITIRTVNGKDFFYQKGSDKPLTGWMKSNLIEDNMPNLIHATNGKIDREWKLYSIISPEYEITYDLMSNAKAHGIKGVRDIRQWMPNGKPCPDTNVVGGQGKHIKYDAVIYYKVGGGSNNDISPPPIKAVFYKNGAIDKSETIDTIFDIKRRKEEQSRPRSDEALASSADFDNGFLSGVTKKRLPYDDNEAYEAGRKYGRDCKSMPAYTQGYNKGVEEGLRKESIKSNPYNRISQKVDWLAWNFGYSEGHLAGGLSRAFQGSQ